MDGYQIQLDDSCQIGAPCEFPSPEIDIMVADPYYTPAAPLAVPSSGPHRQTYCWRVRGCHEDACGEWSAARCFVVGAEKTPTRDINGDGYADLVIGAPGYLRDTRNGRAAVYLGGAELPDQPVLVLEGTAHTSFGESVAIVGDVNGDGYADYLVARQGDAGNMNGTLATAEPLVIRGTDATEVA